MEASCSALCRWCIRKVRRAGDLGGRGCNHHPGEIRASLSSCRADTLVRHRQYQEPRQDLQSKHLAEKRCPPYTPFELDFSFFSRRQDMSKVIVRFLAILGALWLVAMVIMIVAVIGTKGKVPEKTILEANFEQVLPEDVPDSPT